MMVLKNSCILMSDGIAQLSTLATIIKILQRVHTLALEQLLQHIHLLNVVGSAARLLCGVDSVDQRPK